LFAGNLLEEGDLAGNEARMLRCELIDDDGPGPAVGVVAQLEAVRELGDHTDVGLSPPFAVGNHIKTSVLLQCHDIADRRIDGDLIGRACQRRASVDQVKDKGRARHGADDGGGEQGAAHAVTCHWRRASS
jgi:hypothetical protein